MRGHVARVGQSNKHVVCHATCVTGINTVGVQMEFNGGKGCEEPLNTG